MQETWVQSLCQENPLVKEIATHSNILAWEISPIEEPGGLQSMGLQGVGQDLATKQQQQIQQHIQNKDLSIYFFKEPIQVQMYMLITEYAYEWREVGLKGKFAEN